MPSFAAPAMTAVGTIGGNACWDIGALPVGFNAGQPFSIEAWVMPGMTNGVASRTATVVGKDQEFWFGVVGGLVSAQWNGPALRGVTTLQAGIWYYIAVTYDGATLTLYLDGVAEASAPYTGPGSPPTGNPFLIGANGIANDPFDVWSVTLYSAPRTARQEADAPWIDLAPAPGLVANFDFSVAPPRETVAGQSITPRNGAVSQTVAPDVTFDGLYGGIRITDPQQPLVVPAQFTASAWIAFDGSPGLHAIMSSGDPAADQGCFLFGIEAPAPDVAVLFVSVANQGIEQTISVAANDWHNVAVTCDGGRLTLYLDGQSIAQAPLTVTPEGSSSPFWTGGFAILQYEKTAWFAGGLQWLSLWGRCLTPDEVVYQQYASVSSDAAILLDAALDGGPTDLANALQIEYGGTAAPAVQRRTVTTWSPPPEQLNPPSDDGAAARPSLTSVRWPTPVSTVVRPPAHATPQAELAAATPDLEANLRGLDAAVAAALRERFRQSTLAAMAAPPLAPPASWRRDGDDQVFTFIHPTEGAQELLRVRADGITNCQMWWMTFTFTLLFGIAGLLFVRIRGQDLSQWIQRRVLNNQTVMEALQAAWRANPDFTGFTVINLLAAIYHVGLLKNFLYFVAYQISYYCLFKLALWVAGSLLSGGATAVLFAANAAVLAVQLGMQVTGGQNIPGYSASCGSGETCDVALPQRDVEPALA